MQRVSGETEVKQCIPSPSMLHLICCIREENYQPIEKYQDNDVLLKDIAFSFIKKLLKLLSSWLSLFSIR